jgi:molecular chaperone GrpE
MAKKASSKQNSANVTELEAQIAALTEALQRERADATNIRRQHDEQLSGLQSLVKANVVRDLLPVIDNFERALKHEPKVDLAKMQTDDAHPQTKQLFEIIKKQEEYVNGVRGLVKQFEKTLEDIGVTKIKTVGEPFDPKYHEAVSMEEGSGEREIVSEELQAGYTIGNDVIRHAMVRVRLS